VTANVFSQSNKSPIAFVDCGGVHSARFSESFSDKIQAINAVEDDFGFNGQA